MGLRNDEMISLLVPRPGESVPFQRAETCRAAFHAKLSSNKLWKQGVSYVVKMGEKTFAGSSLVIG